MSGFFFFEKIKKKKKVSFLISLSYLLRRNVYSIVYTSTLWRCLLWRCPSLLIDLTHPWCIERMDKTPRKLIREAPAPLVPEILQKKVVRTDNGKDLMKGFLSKTETNHSESQKKLLANPVFAGFSPQIVDNVFFLELYAVDMHSRNGNGGAPNPNNAHQFVLGENGTITPKAGRSGPTNRASSIFGAIQGGSSTSQSVANDFSPLTAVKRGEGTGRPSSPRKALSLPSAQVDTFELLIMGVNAILFCGIVFTALLLLVVVTSNIELRFSERALRNVVYSATGR